jgi:hypothetical protein
MLGGDEIELLESGCSLTVGLVMAGGQPRAGRGWGLSIAADRRHVRLLVNAADIDGLGHALGAPIGKIAVNGADVLTLRSVQLKGPVLDVGPADETDLARMATHCDGFFDAVAVVDSIPRYLMERLVPAEVVACTFEITEAFDQTPGPGAGQPLPRDHGVSERA